MQITLDETKYNISKRNTLDGVEVIAREKYKHCKCCKKKIEVKRDDLVGWYDSNKLWRSGYFCREHKQLILKTLKLIAKG